MRIERRAPAALVAMATLSVVFVLAACASTSRHAVTVNSVTAGAHLTTPPRVQPVRLGRLPARPFAFSEHRSSGGGRVCVTRVPGIENRGQHRGRTTRALPEVDATVSGATVFWLPGFQGTPCHSVRTDIPKSTTGRIAASIDKAPPFPAGPMSCGMDDRTQVWVYFHLSGRKRVQLVRLLPDGCLTASADGLWPRRLPVAVMRALAPYAPPGWSAYLDNGV